MKLFDRIVDFFVHIAEGHTGLIPVGDDKHVVLGGDPIATIVVEGAGAVEIPKDPTEEKPE